MMMVELDDERVHDRRADRAGGRDVHRGRCDPRRVGDRERRDVAAGLTGIEADLDRDVVRVDRLGGHEIDGRQVEIGRDPERPQREYPEKHLRRGDAAIALKAGIGVAGVGIGGGFAQGDRRRPRVRTRSGARAGIVLGVARDRGVRASYAGVDTVVARIGGIGRRRAEAAAGERGARECEHESKVVAH